MSKTPATKPPHRIPRAALGFCVAENVAAAVFIGSPEAEHCRRACFRDNRNGARGRQAVMRLGLLRAKYRGYAGRPALVWAATAGREAARRARKNSRYSSIAAPDFAETLRIVMPGRTVSMLRMAAPRSNSTAAARSIFVRTATSALLKIVGYFSGLSSPSVTDIRTSRMFSPRSYEDGHTRLPTFSMKRKS